MYSIKQLIEVPKNMNYIHREKYILNFDEIGFARLIQDGQLRNTKSIPQMALRQSSD